MAIAESGKGVRITKGSLRVSCVGGASLIEINQDGIGYNKLSGGVVVDGVIPDGAVFFTEQLGGDNVYVRFTGAGTVSYNRV